MIIDNSELNVPTLCLNMIVKNESKIITRLLDSVIKIIDCYCICDTGSTDDTINVITNYFAEKNISGVIVSEPFKNFAHNRNFALQSCINMSDYVLLMDADMKLEINDFDKKSLYEADYFTILQGNEDFYYQNVRIVKNNGLYKYISVTHEYVSSPPDSVAKSIDKDKLFISDLGDGGCKSDKFERDILLLTEGIKTELDNPRYYFYLANSYHDIGKCEEAIDNYRKRIKLGGWVQEIWYSYYRIGLCYKRMDKMNDAVCEWLNAFNCLPERVENLYEIVLHYRLISKQKLADMFYSIAKKIVQDKTINKDSFLFLHNDIYTYKLYYEYTIISYYNNIKLINDEIVLVLNNCNDYTTKNNLLINMKYYKFILNPIKTIVLTTAVTKNINDDFVTMNSSSSCLIPNKNKDGYLMNLRYVNYYINDRGNYLNCDKYIITHNKYYELNTKLDITYEKWLETEFDNRRYIGIEDVRIYYENDDLRFIGTGYHKNEKIGIVYGKYDLENSKFISNEITPTFSNSQCEKNWVYVDYNNTTHIIYKWFPLEICSIDKANNKINIIERKNMPKIFNNVRGSTCGFNYNVTTKGNNIYLNNGNNELE